jgi:hypothetical protein
MFYLVILNGKMQHEIKKRTENLDHGSKKVACEEVF